jgi:hypothetical protein
MEIIECFEYLCSCRKVYTFSMTVILTMFSNKSYDIFTQINLIRSDYTNINKNLPQSYSQS